MKVPWLVGFGCRNCRNSVKGTNKCTKYMFLALSKSFFLHPTFFSLVHCKNKNLDGIHSHPLQNKITKGAMGGLPSSTWPELTKRPKVLIRNKQKVIFQDQQTLIPDLIFLIGGCDCGICSQTNISNTFYSLTYLSQLGIHYLLLYIFLIFKRWKPCGWLSQIAPNNKNKKPSP